MIVKAMFFVFWTAIVGFATYNIGHERGKGDGIRWAHDAALIRLFGDETRISVVCSDLEKEPDLWRHCQIPAHK